MSHIVVRKRANGKHDAFGHTWWYDFRLLPRVADRSKATTFVESHFQQCGTITKGWNQDTNSEWIVRCYLAARLIMASTLYLNSYRHANKVNLRVPGTFLQYYAALFSMRACIMTSPREEWRNGKLARTTHSKAINVSCDILSRLTTSAYADDIKQEIAQMKAHRELISYIAPSRGDRDIALLDEPKLVALCMVFCEVAQLQSEIIELALHRRPPNKATFTLKDEYFEQACIANIEGIDFVDKEDVYRLGYLRRKYPLMTNVCHMISEGHSEDFFGSWLPKDEEEEHSEGAFNPDNDTRIIFDIP